MRPLAGVVTARSKKSLSVQVETGVHIEMSAAKVDISRFKVGDKCWISYDFSRNEVSKIFADEPTLEEVQDTTEETVVEGEVGVETEVEEEDLEEVEASEDLLPPSDEWGFWDPDSGILELS